MIPVPEVVTLLVSDVALNFTVAVPGPTTDEVITRESPAALAKKLLVAVTAVVDSEVTAVRPVVPVRVNVSDETTADEGATERTPRPNAATATSAMRLKVVFVDILFLSVVVMKTFSMAALR